MAAIPVKNPTLVKQIGNMNVQREKLDEAATQTWLPNSLVTNTSGALVLVATAGVLVYGLTPDGSHLSTDKPPVAFNGQTHWPFDLSNTELEISVIGATRTLNATDAEWQDVTIGAQYGIYTETANTAGKAPKNTQMLDLSNTTNKLFTVLGPASDTVALTDTNVRVRVALVPTTIQ